MSITNKGPETTGLRLLVILAAAAGAFGSLDTALNVAFPDLVDDFGIEVADLQLVVISFVASYGALLLVAGRLGDRMGHRRILTVGAAASAVAMVACAAAPSYELLVAARIGQGMTAALVMASAPALLSTSGAGVTRAAAVFQTAAGIGLTAGPLLGGWLVAIGGWRAVFWARVPLAVMLVLLGWLAIAATAKDARGRERPAAVGGGTGPVSGPTTRAAPSALRLVRRPGFVVANSLTLAVNGSMFVVWLLVPSMLVDEIGLSVTYAGLVLALSPFATSIASARAEAAIRRWSAGAVGGAGIAITGAGLAVIAVRPNVGQLADAVLVAAAMALLGIGLGMFTVPNMAFVLGSLPADQQGLAGGLTLTMRMAGIVGGSLVWSALLDAAQARGLSFDEAARLVIGSSAAVCAGLVVLNATRRRPAVEPALN